jgi:hypothetical protein
MKSNRSHWKQWLCSFLPAVHESTFWAIWRIVPPPYAATRRLTYFERRIAQYHRLHHIDGFAQFLSD